VAGDSMTLSAPILTRLHVLRRLALLPPVLHHDGVISPLPFRRFLRFRSDEALTMTLEDAFPGSRLSVEAQNGRFELLLQQHGLLRTLSAAELSDGTLRYLLWAAALLTSRPPELMVLNEPETSLHPDLLPALARLILAAAKTRKSLWFRTHCNSLSN